MSTGKLENLPPELIQSIIGFVFDDYVLSARQASYCHHPGTLDINVIYVILKELKRLDDSDLQHLRLSSQFVARLLIEQVICDVDESKKGIVALIRQTSEYIREIAGDSSQDPNAQLEKYWRLICAAVKKRMAWVGSDPVLLNLSRPPAKAYAPPTKEAMRAFALGAAACENDVPLVALILKHGVDVNASTEFLGNPLQAAVTQGSESAVSMLLDQDDIDVNVTELELKPLHAAAEVGHEGIVRRLLDRSDVHADSVIPLDGRTPLFIAARHGHSAVVGVLAARKDVNVDSRDCNGWKALTLAAQMGHKVVVDILLARGAAAFSPDRWGRTPLSYAAEMGHEAVVGLLLDREGINPTARKRECRAALLKAAANGHTEVVRLLVGQGTLAEPGDFILYQTAGQTAATNGHYAVVEILFGSTEVDVKSLNVNPAPAIAPLV